MLQAIRRNCEQASYSRSNEVYKKLTIAKAHSGGCYMSGLVGGKKGSLDPCYRCKELRHNGNQCNEDAFMGEKKVILKEVFHMFSKEGLTRLIPEVSQKSLTSAKLILSKTEHKAKGYRITPICSGKKNLLECQIRPR